MQGSTATAEGKGVQVARGGTGMGHVGTWMGHIAGGANGGDTGRKGQESGHVTPLPPASLYLLAPLQW